MSVVNETLRQVYQGNGVTTAFDVDFKVTSAENLHVLKKNTLTEVETELTLSTNFTVTIDDDEGALVTMLVAPTVNEKLYIYSNAPLTQETEFEEDGDVSPRALVNALDKLTILVKQVSEKADRAAKFPKTSDSVAIDPTLSEPDPGKGLIWNVDGTGFTTTNDDLNDLVTDATAAKDAAEDAQAAAEMAEAGASDSAIAAAASAVAAAASATITSDSVNDHEVDTTNIHGIADTALLVTLAGVQTFTNKTFDADGTGNNLTNVDDANIKSGAAIAHAKMAALTVSRALVSDGSGVVSPATTTSTEIGYVNGVTSAIQTQLDAKQLRSTLTTKGDLYIATASNTVTRMPVGTDGQVLTADSTQTNGVKYASVSSLNNLGVVSKTTTFTALTSDDVILCSAAGGVYTGTLYTASGNSGKVLRFVKTGSDTNAVTIDGSGSETIGGTLNVKIVLPGDAITIVSDGTNWQVLSNEIKIHIQAYNRVPSGTLTSAISIARFTALDRDTHGAYNTATGVFTAPSSGIYAVSGKVDISAASAAVNNYVAVGFQYNGSTSIGENFFRVGNTATTQANSSHSLQVYLAAGDTLALTARSNMTTPIFATGLASSEFSIVRVK